ncbi:flagellar basal body P-ring formation chaperone FlgA [Chitinasiproducens palmae]|uniref:Flagella basal body P-ring formation protein FlgA n=1 Tax=Chitinasiproducens palmae TaxID=1770053 RepID=A0A1H2PJP7_9BURK|nr:flagella basal body P-ring formation protein FlgA [Chitinasiproducens palmae]
MAEAGRHDDTGHTAPVRRARMAAACVMAWLALAPGVCAAQAGAERQDPEAIRATAEAFAREQAAGLPGRVEVAITAPAPRGLAACASLEPFLPPGGRLWGRATIGVRCLGPRPWTVYLQARVSVTGTYYVAARNIEPGETLSAADLTPRDGDLTLLPVSVLTDPAQAIGGVASNRINAGLPVRGDLVRAALAVRAGQPVRLVAEGPGFAITAEGSALGNASAGQPVRVRTESGTVVSGRAREDGSVDVSR